MLPYLIAGAIGYAVAKLLEEDEAPKYADGGSVLLAPNGKPSNLTPEQYKLVRLPEFKAWFGDWENDPANSSKVIDENGEPLVCYRGDNRERNIFNEDTFFSSNDYVAGSYSNENAIPEYEVFLNIRNPLNLLGGNELRTRNGTLISGSDPYLVNAFKEAIMELPNDYKIPALGGYLDKEKLFNLIIRDYNNIEYIDYDTQSTGWDAIIKYAKKEGFDGVFMLDESFDKFVKYQDSQITFNANQIKLADGSNTTFDSNNPDIRFDEGGELVDNIFDYLIKEKGFAPLGKGFWGKSNCTIKIDFSNVLYLDKDNRVWSSPIEYNDYKKAFTILEFHCKDKKKGIGTAVLKEIIQGADLFGYTIFIEPTSIKKYRVETDINTNDLKRWYSKYDFKPLNDNYSDNVWLRNPNNPDIRFDGGGVSELNNYLHNIRLDEWYMENEIMDDDDNIEQYKADFGRKGSIVFRVYPDETGNINSSIYISSIGRGTLDYGVTQSIEGKKDSRGEGAKAIASLFLLYPNVDSFHYEDESYFENEDKSFWKKIGGDSSELFRKDFFIYFENKFGYNPDIRFDGGGKVQPKDLTKINNFNNIQKGVDYYSYSDNLEKQEKADRWFELFVINQKEKQLNKIEFNEFMQLSNELAWEDLD